MNVGGGVPFHYAVNTHHETGESWQSISLRWGGVSLCVAEINTHPKIVFTVKGCTLSSVRKAS